MSQIIDTFTSRKGRPPVHDWESWMDGQSRRLYKGRDFSSELISMRTMIHRKARDMGINAYTHINEADQSIQVRFYTKDDV
jgi:hypothetical protein